MTLAFHGNALAISINEKLVNSITNGDYQMLKQALDDGADPNLRMEAGMTPLHLVAGQGYYKMVDILVDAGADVNLTEALWGSSPLIVAATNGYRKVVERLLERGANIAIQDGTGRRAYDHARESGFGEIASLVKPVTNDSLTSDPMSPEAMLEAIRNNDVKTVAIMLEKGFDPNTPVQGEVISSEYRRVSNSAEDETVFLLACELSNPKIIKLFLDSGANVDTKLVTGHNRRYVFYRPIVMPISDRDPEEYSNATQVTKMLLEAGADSDVVVYMSEFAWVIKNFQHPSNYRLIDYAKDSENSGLISLIEDHLKNTETE